MNTRQSIFLIILGLILFAPVCQAQVYIFVRRDANDFVYTENEADGYCKTLIKVTNKKAGEWVSLLETDKPGYIVLFGVAHQEKGIKPKYFVSFGKETQEEAYSEAESSARAYAASINLTRFVLLNYIINKNKFPLERPIPNMEKGTCKTEIVPPETKRESEKSTPKPNN